MKLINVITIAAMVAITSAKHPKPEKCDASQTVGEFKCSMCWEPSSRIIS